MDFICKNSNLSGKLRIPASKSHTIRAVCFAAMASGTSKVRNPLYSNDAQAAVDAVRVLGATVDQTDETCWVITGVNNSPKRAGNIIDVQNSGTTIQIILALAALLPHGEQIILTGDHQICRRPTRPLLDALKQLGTDIEEEFNNGCPPIILKGGLNGGKCVLEAKTSQYVTALLMACPLAKNNSEIEVTLLNEAPYVQITLDWLKYLGINIENQDLLHYKIPGNQAYQAFDRETPADFSTATFFVAAAAIQNDRKIILDGLDFNDSQPDKQVFDVLSKMGANIEINSENQQVIVSAPNGLTGIDIDMNDMPDALPMLAVVGCFAKGTTRLHNVAHARLKETDRIACMAKELSKMGANIEETPDGLIIKESKLVGTEVEGHHDHRIVMSLAIAGLSITGTTTINTAEAAAVTVPKFFEFITSLGGDIQR